MDLYYESILNTKRFIDYQYENVFSIKNLKNKKEFIFDTNIKKYKKDNLFNLNIKISEIVNDKKEIVYETSVPYFYTSSPFKIDEEKTSYKIKSDKSDGRTTEFMIVLPEEELENNYISHNHLFILINNSLYTKYVQPNRIPLDIKHFIEDMYYTIASASMDNYENNSSLYKGYVLRYDNKIDYLLYMDLMKNQEKLINDEVSIYFHQVILLEDSKDIQDIDTENTLYLKENIKKEKILNYLYDCELKELSNIVLKYIINEKEFDVKTEKIIKKALKLGMIATNYDGEIYYSFKINLDKEYVVEFKNDLSYMQVVAGNDFKEIKKINHIFEFINTLKLMKSFY